MQQKVKVLVSFTNRQFDGFHRNFGLFKPYIPVG